MPVNRPEIPIDPSDPITDAPPREAKVAARPKWDRVVLVCKDCAKRKSGPTHLKAKELVGGIKKVSGGIKPRPRILMTNCLGLCPKAANAVAAVGEDSGARIVAIRGRKDLKAKVAALFGP